MIRHTLKHIGGSGGVTMVVLTWEPDDALDVGNGVEVTAPEPDIDTIRRELAACNDALPHFAPFTPPPLQDPPLTNQPAPSDPPQRRRRHRVQARAPPT